MTYYTIGQSIHYLERVGNQILHSCVNSFNCQFKGKRQSWWVEPIIREPLKWNSDEIIKGVFKVISTTKYIKKL